MIPFYRYVESTDDGCGVNQCLSCYQQWEGRTSPEWSGWKFCPYCGCKWEGKLECREQHQPAWLYRLKQQDQQKWEEWERDSWSRSTIPRKRGWVIESRDCRAGEGDGWVADTRLESDRKSNWNVHVWQSDYGVTTLRMVLSQLASLRQQAAVDLCEQTEWPWKHWTEYRARIIDFNRPAHSYCASIWQHGRDSEETRSLVDIWKQKYDTE
jgi:hypothetical protein